MLYMIGWCSKDDDDDVIGVLGHPKHGTPMKVGTAERVLAEWASLYPDRDHWLENCEGETAVQTGSALLEGIFAYRHGRPRSANPYTDETLKAAWDRGWDFDSDALGGPPKAKT
jgi:hypothetical protein